MKFLLGSEMKTGCKTKNRNIFKIQLQCKQKEVLPENDGVMEVLNILMNSNKAYKIIQYCNVEQKRVLASLALPSIPMRL